MIWMPQPTEGVRPKSSSSDGWLVWAVVAILACTLLAGMALLWVSIGGNAAAGVSFLSPTLTPTTVPTLERPVASLTFTPFLPVSDTETPTPAFTPTPTWTPSPTPTLTSTPTATPTMTPTSTPGTPLPERIYIEGVIGRSQALPLSCESRSAADWAGFFGIPIDELDFQSRLPSSDNPMIGFVGNPNDLPGRLPPRSYGVYSPPVAELLRAYGLNAHAHLGMTWVQAQGEVAAGRPVIAWVIGDVQYGNPRSYTASDGQMVTVAYFEHTVILIGYTHDTVTVVDGGLEYSPPLARFLASWAVLGNMAVTAGE